MDRLPPEILTEIFSYLSYRDLLSSVSKVCRYWRSTSFSSVLWMDFGISYDCTDREIEFCFRNISHVADLIQTLQICIRQLNTVFETIELNADTFSNLRKLQMFGDLPDDAVYFCKHIVKVFPNLKSINIVFGKYNDLLECLQILSILQLNGFEMRTSISSNSELLNFISGQPNLTSLSISDEELKSETLSQILNCLGNLKCLEVISMNEIYSSAFDGLSEFSNLTEIRFSSTGVDDKGLQLITTRALNLKLVDLLDNTKLTDVGIGYIANNCSNLECLTIIDAYGSQNIRLSSRTLKMLGKKCTKIKRICFEGATHLDDPGLISLVNSSKQLQRIAIQSDKISTAPLIAISDVCAGLSHLKIDGKNLYVSGIEHVLSQCRQLKCVSFEYCLDINKIDLGKFINGDGTKTFGCLRHSCVSTMIIEGHPVSSITAVEKITEFCPNLRGLFLPNLEETCANNFIHIIHETAFRKCKYLVDLYFEGYSTKDIKFLNSSME